MRTRNLVHMEASARSATSHSQLHLQHDANVELLGVIIPKDTFPSQERKMITSLDSSQLPSTVSCCCTVNLKNLHYPGNFTKEEPGE